MKFSKIALFLILIALSLRTMAQPRDNTLLKKDYERSLKLLNSFKVDSAKTILTTLVNKLQGRNELNTEFGMKVLLKQAEAWENDHDDQKAIQQLLSLVNLSESKSYWNIYAEANISLARLYEKLGLEGKCHNRLLMAKLAIETSNLILIYPRFAIRMSSYHRVFKSQLDSARFYALLALKTVSKDNLSIHEGTANLLLALIDFHNEPNNALKYYEKAGVIFKKLGDFTGYSYTLLGQSLIYKNKGLPMQALKINNAAMAAARIAKEQGNEQYYLVVDPLRARAQIFKEMKNLDSSWYYINEAQRIEVDAISKANNDEIIEVEARYLNNLKNQKLRQQEIKLKLERQRRNLIILGLIASLIFTFFVLYLYNKLRKSFKLEKEQAFEIKKTNEDLNISLKQQNSLQKEVHHRVTNNLQTLISLIEIQAEKLTSTEAIQNLETLSNRIWSMAIVHEMLYQDQNLDAINVQRYVEKMCGHLRGFSELENRIICTIEMNNLYFNLQTLIPIGLIINELFTNSVKYASAPDKDLKLLLSIKKKQDEYVLLYKDNGMGFAIEETNKKSTGIGLYLVDSMVRQLKGHLEQKNINGMEYEIFFKAVGV